MAGIPLSKKIQNELQKDNGQYVLKPAVGKYSEIWKHFKQVFEIIADKVTVITQLSLITYPLCSFM